MISLKNSEEKAKIIFFAFILWNGGHIRFYDAQQGTYNFKTALSYAEKMCSSTSWKTTQATYQNYDLHLL